MNKNMLIVLAGGFLIAVLVAVMVQFGLKGRATKVVAQNVPAAQIAVAAKDLASGSKITDADVKWQDWPASGIFPGALVKKDGKAPAGLVDGRLRRSVSAGEPIVEGALLKAGYGNIIASTLGEGMRAVAIDVSPARMAGGFIGPGDYVDILLTYRQNVTVPDVKDPRVDEMLKLSLGNLATETILQNVKVMAVDQTPSRDDTKQEGKVGRTITVEVDAHGAEVLALTPQLGTLSLALRRLGDTAINAPENPVVTDERIIHITRELYDQAHKIAGQNSNVVRFYNGYTVEDQPTVSP
jgi:pilus assembly protein CpaB